MKKILIPILAVFMCSAYARVGIIVNKDLYQTPIVKTNVKRYIADLVNTSESVWVDTTTFIEGNTIAQIRQLRDSLRSHYLTDNLTGAVLIGNLPYAMFEIGNANLVPITNIKDYWYMEYPVDYYLMDINDPLDNAWHDDSTESTRPGLPGDTLYPYKKGVFDKYTGDKTCEIWVSRVIAHNLFHNTAPTKTPMAEDSVIAEYFDRVHARMTSENTVPRRAIQVGDFKNWFDTSWACIENLSLPYEHLKFPNDRSARYVVELRKGYEWLSVLEHSGPEAHVMGMDQGPIERNDHYNKFYSFDNPWWPDERSLLQMIDKDRLPPKVLFYQDLGCDNVNFNDDRCQGEMYAMLQNGLICMGSSKEYYPTSQSIYTSTLASGVCFGESFRRFLNAPSLDGSKYAQLVDPAGCCLVLVGAGTLKLAPYVASASPKLIIDSMTVATADAQPYLLHNNVLRLHAKISASNGATINPSLLKLTWYGAADSIGGNDVDFVLDGHDAPRYGNGIHQGTYTIMLHAEYPGYFVASKKLEFDGWNFSKIGTFAGLDTAGGDPIHINYHAKDGGLWDLHVRGASGDIKGNADDFVYYYRQINMQKYYISARIKSLANMTNTGAKAGVMIRSGLAKYADPSKLRFSGSDQQVFFGVTFGGTVVFQYRTADNGPTTTREYSGFSVGGTWVKIIRAPGIMYALTSTNGVDFGKIDSLATSGFQSPIVGYAYACNDSTVWGNAGERWVVFGNTEMRQSTAMSIPAVYAKDTVVAGDRVRFESATVGVRKWFKAGMDDSIFTNLYVSGNARIEDRTRVTGNITLSGKLAAVNGASYSGKLTEGAYVEFEPLPQKTFNAGTSSLTVANDKSVTLTGGGSYKTVFVDSRGSIVINAGTYYFDSLSLNTDAKITLNGHVEINVQKGIYCNDRVTMTGLPASDKVFYSNGTTVTIGQFTFIGYLTAPNAKVTIRSRATFKGRVAAKSIVAENDSKITDQ